MARVEEVYITPTLGTVVTSLLCVLDANCLEFCGLPYMVLLCLADQHINRSWTLLRAFGPHGLLIGASPNGCHRHMIHSRKAFDTLLQMYVLASRSE